MTTVKVLGITDERTTCDCCGKSNLKRTVALELENGQTVYYGTTCAMNAFRGIDKAIKAAQSKYDWYADVKGRITSWTAKGHDPKVICSGVWLRCGMSLEYRDNGYFFRGELIAAH